MNAEDLAGFGKVAKEVEPLAGLKVTFHSLSVKEEEAINNALAGLPSDIIARSTGLQIETLCHSIEKLGGRAFTDIKELREYLQNLQRHTLSSLYECWSKEFDTESAKQVEDLKKTSAPPVPA